MNVVNMRETKSSFSIHIVLFRYLFIHLFIYVCDYCEVGSAIGSAFDWYSIDPQFEYRPRHLL
jgi:hypothetical protein